MPTLTLFGVILLASTSLAAPNVEYPPPAPTPSGRTGAVVQSFPGQAAHSWTEGVVVAAAPGGGLYVGGVCDYSGNYTGGNAPLTGVNFDWVLSRYDSAGLLDTTFATYGQLRWSLGAEDDELSGLTVQSGDKVLLAGISWDATGGNQTVQMVRLNADGTQDLQFGALSAGNTVSLYSDAFRDQNAQLNLQSSGKIILYTTDVITVANRRMRIARFHPNGSVDTTFGPKTTPQGIPVGSGLIEVQPDGRDTPGPPYYGHILTQSDDKLVAGGSHDTTGGGVYKGFVVRVLSDGSATDSTFGTQFADTSWGAIVTFSHNGAGSLTCGLPGVILTPAGGILACGYSPDGSGNAQSAAALLSSAGVLDTSFNATGRLEVVVTTQPENFLFQPLVTSGGAFRFAGYAGDVTSTVDVTTHALALGYTAAGAVDGTWGTAGVVEVTGGGLCLFFDAAVVAGATYVAGHQAYPATAIAQAIARRYTAAGALDPSWGDFAAAPAVPTAPTVVTGASSAVTATAATVAGTVNPHGTATTFHAEWGLTTNYGQKSAEVTVGTQSAAQSVGANLTGLIPGKTYHYRIVALAGNPTDGMAVGLGADGNFATSAGTFTLLSDTFAGADGDNLRDHVAATDYTGGAYVTVKGISTIESNKARWDSDPGSGAGNKQSIVQHETNNTDVTVTATVTWNGALDGSTEYEGVIARCVAHSDGEGAIGNFLHAGWTADGGQVFRVLSRVNSSDTVHASAAFVPVVGTAYTLTLTVTGTAFTATLNPGGLSLNGTPSAALAANTQAGWILNYGLGDTVDDFSVTTP